MFRAIGREVETEIDGDRSGHDMHHAWRVLRLGLRLAEECDANELIVGAAALTHDIHRTMGGSEFVDPRDSLPVVDDVLAAVEFPAEKRDAVRHCVAVHEEYGFESESSAAESVEAELLQDADNLDAMGAIGVGRTFRFSGARGTPMWTPEADSHACYDKTDYSRSVLDHFDDKLLRLKDDLNTDAAVAIAEGRHRFMVEFVDRFEREWRGEA